MVAGPELVDARSAAGGSDVATEEYCAIGRDAGTPPDVVQEEEPCMLRTYTWLRIASALSILFVALVFGVAPTAAEPAAADSAPMSSTCDASLPLVLTPGAHWPGAGPQEIPDDLPPGTLSVDLPLYPGAIPTDEQEEMPSFTVPGTTYLKSGSVTYHVPGTQAAVLRWYRTALKACGYAHSGSQSSGRAGTVLSQAISVSRTQGSTRIDTSISIAAANDGGTLILYVGTATVPPVYPAPGSILRVSGAPVFLRITEYAGFDAGPISNKPVQSTTVHDAAEVQSIAGEINHLPKYITEAVACPKDDGSHLKLVFRDTAGVRHIVRVHLQGCEFVLAPPAPTGVLYADPKLLPRLTELLNRSGSRLLPINGAARGE
jgi:hypothetical protein